MALHAAKVTRQVTRQQLTPKSVTRSSRWETKLLSLELSNGCRGPAIHFPRRWRSRGTRFRQNEWHRWEMNKTSRSDNWELDYICPLDSDWGNNNDDDDANNNDNNNDDTHNHDHNNNDRDDDKRQNYRFGDKWTKQIKRYQFGFIGFNLLVTSTE